MSRTSSTPTIPEPILGWSPERQVARLTAWLTAATADDPTAIEMFTGLVFDGSDPREAAATVIGWWKCAKRP